MKKSSLYKKKKEIMQKIKTSVIDDNSRELLKSLGFSVKFDGDCNLYLWDDIHNERMYTNVLSIAGIPYRCSENKYFSLEFCLFNKKITNVSLYNKKSGKTMILKNDDKKKKADN